MVAQTKITFNLKGLDDLTKKLDDEYRARVGILGADVARKDGGPLDNATLGVIQMFGSVTKNIPARDFLFMPIQTHARDIVQALKKSSIKAAVATGNVKQAYALLGAEALGWVLKAFETGGFGQWPAHKSSTVARYGEHALLILSGQLRRAQTSDVVKKSDIA